MTRHDSERHHRRSIRIPGYDYTRPGVFFLAICTHDRTCLFGEIANGEMRLSDAGRVAQMVWEGIPEHFPHVELGAFVVMPNHVHGVIVITSAVGATHASPLRNASPLPRPSGPSQRSIGAIVGSYKSAASKRINELRRTPGAPVWQRNCYEHIMRDEVTLNRVRQYITENPARWAEDLENPARVAPDTGTTDAPVGATHASPLQRGRDPR